MNMTQLSFLSLSGNPLVAMAPDSLVLLSSLKTLFDDVDVQFYQSRWLIMDQKPSRDEDHATRCWTSISKYTAADSRHLTEQSAQLA